MLGILLGHDSTLVTDSVSKKILNKVMSKKVLEKTLRKHSGICPSGGTYTTTPQVVDSKTVVIEDRFTDCKSEVALGETPLILVRNGTIKREYSDPSFQGTDPLTDSSFKDDHWVESRSQYVEEYFDPQDGVMLLRRLEDNYIMEIVAPTGPPGVRETFKSIFWAREGTMQWYDRVPRADGSVVPEEWTIEFQNHRWETTSVSDGYQTDQSELSRSVQDGTWIFTDHLNPDKSYNITYKNFVTTEYIDDAGYRDASGNRVKYWVQTMDGGLLVDCIEDEISVQTIVPIRTPVVYPSVCPIEGKIRFTVGESSSFLTHTSDGGLEIDADGDGSIDEQIEGCSLTFSGCLKL